MRLPHRAAAGPGGTTLASWGERMQCVEGSADVEDSGNRALRLAVSAAQTAAQAVASPPCSFRLLDNVDFLIDVVFLDSRAVADRVEEKTNTERVPRRRRRSRGGERSSVETAAKGEKPREKTRRRKVSPSGPRALRGKEAESDSEGPEASVLPSSDEELQRYADRTAGSATFPVPPSGTAAESTRPDAARMPSCAEVEQCKENERNYKEARTCLSLFARHPAAWSLCLRALERAAALLSPNCLLANNELPSQPRGLSSLRDFSLFSDSAPGSLSACWRPDCLTESPSILKSNTRSNSTYSSNSSAPLTTETEAAPVSSPSLHSSGARCRRSVEHGGDDKSQFGSLEIRDAAHLGMLGEGAAGVSLGSAQFARVSVREEEAKRRLFARSLFAARVLRLLANVGLPFLQLPLPPPRLRSQELWRRRMQLSLFPEAEGATSGGGSGDQEVEEDGTFEILPALCFGGEKPLHVNQGGMQTPTVGRQEGGFFFRVSPFVPLSLAPPPLAAPQLLHRELAALLQLSCLYTSLFLAASRESCALPASGSASTSSDAGERVEAPGLPEAKSGDGASETEGRAQRDRFREVTETLYEAAASLLAHIVAQQQLNSGTSLPLLQQKTGIQRAVSVARLFCFAGADADLLSSSLSAPKREPSEAGTGAEGQRSGDGLLARAVFARVSVGLVQALAQLAVSRDSHLASAEHRALFRDAFLQESPLVLLLLQEALSVAVSLLETTFPQSESEACLDAAEARPTPQKRRQLETSHRGPSPLFPRVTAFSHDLLSVSLETTRQILRFWKSCLGNETEQAFVPRVQGGSVGDSFTHPDASKKETGPSCAGASAQRNADRWSETRSCRGRGKAAGAEIQGETEDRFSSGATQEGKDEADLSAHLGSGDAASGCLARKQKSERSNGGLSLEKSEACLKGIAAALVLGDGEIVRRLVTSLLVLLQAIPGVATREVPPGSSVSNGKRSFAVPASSIGFFGGSAKADLCVHALASDVVALFFSLSSSFFFLPSPYLPRPPLRDAVVSTYGSSQSPSLSPTCLYASSPPSSLPSSSTPFPRSCPLLSIEGASEATAGEVAAHVEAAAKETPRVLPRLLRWIQLAAGRDSLCRTVACLLPLLRASSPRLSAFQLHAVRLLLAWILPLSRQLCPSLLAAHLLYGETSPGDGEAKREDGGRASDLGRRGKEKAKAEKRASRDAAPSGSGLGDAEIFALSARLHLPVVGTLHAGSETAPLARRQSAEASGLRQAQEPARKSGGGSREGRAGGAPSRRRGRSGDEREKEKTEAGLCQAHCAEENAELGKSQSFLESLSPPVLILLRFLALLQHSRDLEESDALAAVECLSRFMSPFLGLVFGPSVGACEKRVSPQNSAPVCLPRDQRVAAVSPKSENAKSEGGENAEDEPECTNARRVLEALRKVLHTGGLLPELVGAALCAAQLPCRRKEENACVLSSGGERLAGAIVEGVNPEERLADALNRTEPSRSSWASRLQQRALCGRFLCHLVVLCGESPFLSLTNALLRASRGFSAASSGARQDASGANGDTLSFLPAVESSGCPREGDSEEREETAASLEVALWACRQAREAARLCGLHWQSEPLHTVALDLLGRYRQKRCSDKQKDKEERADSEEEEAKGAGRMSEENGKRVSRSESCARQPGPGRRGPSGAKASVSQTPVDQSAKAGTGPEDSKGEEETSSRFSDEDLSWALLPVVGAAACLAEDGDAASCEDPRRAKRDDCEASNAGACRSGGASRVDVVQLTIACICLTEDVVRAAKECRAALKRCGGLSLNQRQSPTDSGPLNGRGSTAVAALSSSACAGAEEKVDDRRGKRGSRETEGRWLASLSLCQLLWRELRRVLLDSLVLLNEDLVTAITKRVSFPRETRQTASSLRPCLGDREKRAGAEDGCGSGEESAESRGDRGGLLLLEGRLRALLLLLSGDLSSVCAIAVGGETTTDGASFRTRRSSLRPRMQLKKNQESSQDEQLAATAAACLCFVGLQLTDAEKSLSPTDAKRDAKMADPSLAPHQLQLPSASNGPGVCVSADAVSPRAHGGPDAAAAAPWLWTGRGGHGPEGEETGSRDEAHDFASWLQGEKSVSERTEERAVATQVSLHFMALRGWLLASQVTQTSPEKRRSLSTGQGPDRRALNGEQTDGIYWLWTSQIRLVRRVLFYGETFPEALLSVESPSSGAYSSASTHASLSCSLTALHSSLPTASVSLSGDAGTSPTVRSKESLEGRTTFLGNPKLETTGHRCGGDTCGFQSPPLTLLPGVWRALALLFSSFSRQLVCGAPSGRRASPASSSLRVRKRLPERARKVQVRILRDLSDFMLQCAFVSAGVAPQSSDTALAGSAASAASFPSETGQEERRAEEGGTEFSSLGERGTQEQQCRSDQARQLDLRRSPKVLTAGLVPLLRNVGGSSPACACGAEARTVLLETLFTVLRSLVDLVATTRLHPQGCSCCSCQGLVPPSRSHDLTPTGSEDSGGRRASMQVGAPVTARGDEGDTARPRIVATQGDQKDLSGAKAFDAAEKRRDASAKDVLGAHAEGNMESPHNKEEQERTAGKPREREEKDLECRLCGGCCHECARPLVAALTKVSACWASILRALLACFDSPLLLLPLLNEKKGFALLQRLLYFLLLQGGLRALQMAVHESRQKENFLSVSFASQDPLQSSFGAFDDSCRRGCPDLVGGLKSARLTAAREERADLEAAFELTLKWLLRLVQISRKTVPSCFSKMLDRLPDADAGCTGACRRQGKLATAAEAMVPKSRSVGGSPSRASDGAVRRKRARFSGDQTGPGGRGDPHEPDLKARVTNSESGTQKGVKGSGGRCSCCGDLLSDGADAVSGGDGDSEDESEEVLEDSGYAECRVDRATLAWTIEESCARAATALLRHRLKTPLSRVLREELLVRLGFSASTQDALVRHPLRGLYSVPPMFAFAFPGLSPPAPGRTLPLVGRTPEAIAVASWAPPPLQPLGTQGTGATGASGCVGNSGQPQAVLVGLQQHQALQSMEEQMVRTLEVQQMMEGVAEENEGTDGGPLSLVEILLHTICSLIFATRGEMTSVEKGQWSSLFCPASRGPRFSPGFSPRCWEREAASSCLWTSEFEAQDTSPLGAEADERHQLLLVTMLKALLLPLAARVFSGKVGSFGGSLSPLVNDFVSPFHSSLCDLPDGECDQETEETLANAPVRCGLTVPPRIQLRRWPFIFTFHILASSCLPLWGACFVRRSAFASCCPCCPALESKGSPIEGEGLASPAACLAADFHPGQGADIGTAPCPLAEAKATPVHHDLARSWCACCYCFPQPHSPCIKALTAGNSSLAFVPPAPIAAAASAVASVAAHLPVGPACRSSSARAGEAPGEPEVEAQMPPSTVGVASCGSEGNVFLGREKSRRSASFSDIGDVSGTQLQPESPCAPASLAVFVSALVAAAFKPHLFTLLDTNASYTTNMWEGSTALSSTVGFGGPASSAKGERGDGVGAAAPPATSRGPAANAAVSAVSEQASSSPALQLPYLLHSPPLFLLHPFQEILLEGLPPRFSSLLVGVQAPQPSIVPPIARVAAAVGQALQFTATQRPAGEIGRQVRGPGDLEGRPGALFSLLEEFHKCFFAVDFLRVGGLLQQQQLLHRHRQLDSLVATGRGAVGGAGWGATAGEGDTGSPRATGLPETGGIAALAAGIGAAAAAGDVLALLRLMAPVKPSGTGTASSPSAKETVTGKGAIGGKRGIGAAAGAFGTGATGDQPRKVGGGKGKGKR
ncbi:hypothetical protein TGMAS_226620 [Toxoplasma gondii MAS]|uniref:Uncharacterized protein n=1 Tax=Toxoplasma gondii MAS TaxID=943118 RepID=A0A086QAT6_TOXGO|nr:hypothetical protein TGMAS_226620 [Toxoplasma gondii MAS]